MADSEFLLGAVKVMHGIAYVAEWEVDPVTNRKCGAPTYVPVNVVAAQLPRRERRALLAEADEALAKDRAAKKKVAANQARSTETTAVDTGNGNDGDDEDDDDDDEDDDDEDDDDGDNE